MKKVLMVAYYFPPLGGAGVQRTLKFVKYLPQYGWQPLVLTARQLPNGPRDPGLLDEIPGSTRQYTAPALLLPPQLPWRLRSLVAKWLLVVDEYIGWLPFAVSAGLEIIRSQAPDALYSTSAPYTGHLVARALARKTGLPWVADFRDPWVGNFMDRPVSSLHASLIRRLEAQVVSGASRVIANTEPNRQALLARFLRQPAQKFVTIPNGFDPADFPPQAGGPAAGQTAGNSSGEPFTLVYTGTFYGKERRLKPLLDALQIVHGAHNLPQSRLRLRLVGNVGKAATEEARQSGLTNIEFMGYLPHQAALQQVLDAGAAVLVVGSGPGSAGVYPAKIFEYLAAGKPILCLAEAGIAASLVTDANTGIVAHPDRPAEIAAAILRLYQNWQTGVRQPPDAAVIARFDRRLQAGQLAEILTQIATESKP